MKQQSKETRHLLWALETETRQDHGNGKSIGARTWDESKKMWEIAAPAILTALAQFSIGFVTIAFVGHLGEVELAAVSVVQNVLEGFVFGIMLGMGSALETLCGQAVGAGQYEMLGLYLQRSFIITTVTAFLLLPLYIFTSPILNLLQQDKEISELAGKYSLWVIPQLFACVEPPSTKLSNSTKGLLGAAIAANVSWWIVVFAQLAYAASGCFPESWTGLSLLAFKSLISFKVATCISSHAVLGPMVLHDCDSYGWLVKKSRNSCRRHIHLVSFASRVQFCKYLLYDSMNLELWTLMITLGLSAAISNYFPQQHPVLHGVVVGIGWQFSDAVVNLVCYYVFGLPLGVLLGFKFDLGVKGIWLGMLAGYLLQTMILMLNVLQASWSREALQAEERVRSHAITALHGNESAENGIKTKELKEQQKNEPRQSVAVNGKKIL
ncbi:protein DETOXIFICATION 33 [Sesamum angolense]|uniref:Protein DETOXIFICATION 33 n=1 Tax=Sesamum angolense TaxID=2727404 RepID=A0AAE1WYN8_9LAMI|nr:protein DETOXIFICATION 33 [Sesamum angolense]